MLKHDAWSRLLPIVWAAVTIGVLCAAASPPSGNLATLKANLNAARSSAIANYARIAAETGFADQIIARLDSDQTQITLANPSDAAALEQLSIRIALDASLVKALTSEGPSSPFQQPGGAGLDLFRSSADKTLQPLAIYLPPSYAAEKSAPLILMLHGSQQTEADVVSDPVLRALADKSGVIIAAPWLRGDAPVDSLSTRDVDDALAFLQANYRIDRRRTYLGGVSAGAFNAFMIAPADPGAWAAVLSIGGSLTNDDKVLFARAMRSKPAFLVIGSDDPAIKAEYVQSAASYLNANGVVAHFYEQEGGVQSLESMQPALARAWNDMLAAMELKIEELPSPTPVALPSIRV